MIADVWAILWRDLRGYRAQFEDPRKLALGLIGSILFLMLLELAVGIHDIVSNAHPILLIWIWCWLPLGSAVTLSTDAIAGERERHTLESLLATRIPVRAVLIGKTLSVTIQAWLSALVLACGALVALNLATVWNGRIFIYPWSVVLVGPLLSFLLTLLGALAGLLFSMDAPTVRQANFRIVIVTTILPVLLFVPLIPLLFAAAIIFTLVIQFVDISVDRDTFALSPLTVLAAISFVVGGLLVAIAGTFGVTSLRFTRERLLRNPASSPSSGPAQTAAVEQRHSISDIAGERSLFEAGWTQSSGIRREVTESWTKRCLKVLGDARVVAWKELTEAKGLVREWRGWLILIGIVLTSMIVQLSALGSWYWAQDADTSLLFWIAMAAAMPLFIAQRSADAIAGERERHTGEILFTTRLSHTGILLGKLVVTALLPWSLMLVIPGVGLAAANLFQSSSGPHMYPLDVLGAGLGLTLGVAFLFASIGMLISLGAPTVQHAARRISWLLMPLLVTPGLVLRNSSWSTEGGDGLGFETSGILGFAASGDLTLYALAVVPPIGAVSGALVYILYTRFQRGSTVFD